MAPSDSLSNTVDVPSSANVTDADDVEVDDTVGGVVLLTANKHRKTALIINTGLGTMRVTTDGSAPTATHGKPIPPGASLSLLAPYCSDSVIKAIRQGEVDTTANASEIS